MTQVILLGLCMGYVLSISSNFTFTPKALLAFFVSIGLLTLESMLGLRPKGHLDDGDDALQKIDSLLVPTKPCKPS